MSFVIRHTQGNAKQVMSFVSEQFFYLSLSFI